MKMRTKINKTEPVSHTIQHKSRAANQAPLSVILQAYKERSPLTAPVQREAIEDDDELLQGKFDVAQRESLPDEEEEPLQGKFDVAQRESFPEEGKAPLQHKTENKTGLPDDLKAGVEAASGFSMDDVRVHYNSAKPAQLQALAYTQGTEIHVGPGQEKHLGHEAWHVVQQKQGRVKPTVQMQGVQVNDDEGLEKEADNNKKIVVQRLPDYVGKRPQKPDSLKGKDKDNNPLTAHHVYPWNKIKQDLNNAINNRNRQQMEQIIEFAGNIKVDDDFWSDLASAGTISPGFGAKIKEIARKACWAKHNIFMGPLSEKRSDDPGEERERIYHRGSIQTPISALAELTERSGGIGADPVKRGDGKKPYISPQLVERFRRNIIDKTERNEEKYDPFNWIKDENYMGKVKRR